ncbi:1,2-phenylacetyl-CoA epoxidase subunit PaaE [Nocardiopsis coralliicola]
MTATPDERVRPRRRGVFHPLAVASVEPLTGDAVAITFAVPAELAEEFRFVHGQHVTVRRPAGAGGGGGEAPEAAGSAGEVRRNYSVCSRAPDGPLRIAVKRLPGGAFSTWATEELRAGDVLDVMPPLGRFTAPPAGGTARQHVAVAAGSGITPVLSLVATVLRDEPESTFALVYANRSARDVMFAEELADLKDTYPDRFQLLHVLSRETGDAPLTSGRIDGGKRAELLGATAPDPAAAHWYLCGPYELVQEFRTDLAGRGVPADRVHFELFHVEDVPPPRRAGGPPPEPSGLTFTLDGRTTEAPADPDDPLLTSALRARADAPYACRGGVCGTCRALLREGTVDMPRNFALEPAELAAGYVLTCQSRPTSPHVTVDYDA